MHAKSGDRPRNCAKFSARMHAKQPTPRIPGPGRLAAHLDPTPTHPRPAVGMSYIQPEHPPPPPDPTRYAKRPRTTEVERGRNRAAGRSRRPVYHPPMTSGKRLDQGHELPHRGRSRKPEHMPPSTSTTDPSEPDPPARASVAVFPPPARRRRWQRPHQQRETPAAMPVLDVTTRAHRQPVDVGGHFGHPRRHAHPSTTTPSTTGHHDPPPEPQTMPGRSHSAGTAAHVTTSPPGHADEPSPQHQDARPSSPEPAHRERETSPDDVTPTGDRRGTRYTPRRPRHPYEPTPDAHRPQQRARERRRHRSPTDPQQGKPSADQPPHPEPTPQAWPTAPQRRPDQQRAARQAPRTEQRPAPPGSGSHGRPKRTGTDPERAPDGAPCPATECKPNVRPQE
jgi:hypothetical protein